MKSLFANLLKKLAPLVWLAADAAIDAVYDEGKEFIEKKRQENNLKRKIKRDISEIKDPEEVHPEEIK